MLTRPLEGSEIRVLAVMEAATVTGPARNLLRFARLAREGDGRAPRVALSVATFVRGEPQRPNQFIEAVAAAGIPLEVICERRRFDTGVLAGLRRAALSQRADIVQTHGVKSHLLIRMSGLARTHPWIAFHHGYTAEDLKMRLYNRVDRWTLPRARRVVTVCRPFAGMLAGFGVAPERILVLPNSIEPSAPPAPERVAAAAARTGKQPGEKAVLCIGRFSREKAQIDLVRAASRIAAGRAFRLVFLGDGPERPHVEAAAAAAGLAARCVFAGHQKDVQPWYAAADVLALPSLSEGSPNVLLEAMAAGVPVVATAVGGVPDTVTANRSALLVPAGDPERLGEALARLLDDGELAAALAREARLELERFTPAAYRDRLFTIYRDVAREGR